MIQSSLRKLTPDEHASLLPRTSWLASVWRWMFSLGVSLVFVPFVFGGLVAAVLRLAFALHGTAYVIGLALGYLLGLLVLSLLVAASLQERTETARLRDRLAEGTVEVLRLSGIERAWDVDDLEDLGPGLLLWLEGGELVYFATQDLLDYRGDQGQTCPGRSLTLERVEGSSQLLSMHAQGEPFRVEATSLPGGVVPDLTQTCVILTDKEEERVRRLVRTAGTN